MRTIPIVAALALALHTLPVAAQPRSPSVPAAGAEPDPRKEEARSHFELGLAHFDNSEWGPALAEFLRSRELFPNRAATKDAAICLRKLQRYDEALDMFDTLRREFPDLSPTDRTLVEKATNELRALLGALDVRGAEPGATIIVDGRPRGSFPAPAPIRVSVGSHVVRVYKEGFAPFEGRVEIAAGQTAALEAHLGALTQSGRLRVTEQTGKTLDLVIDNAVVGRTPWEGALATGEHTVVLRGQGTLGTQPASAPVKLGQVTALSLAAEPLEGSARVEPTPAGASVAIDGVVVGRGVWEGRLRVGPHRIEVADEGFVPSVRRLELSKGQAQVIPVSLERDLSSPLWAAAHPSRFTVEVDGAFGPAPLFGGDVVAGCDTCTARPGIAMLGVFHAGYQFSSGLGLSLDAGYLRVLQSVTRPAVLTLVPNGTPAGPGTVQDSLRLGGIALGASGSYHGGESLTFLFRLGAGIFLGTGRDERTGTFTTTTGAVSGLAVTEAPSAAYVYVAPEARLGHRFGSHLEISAGVTAILLVAVKQPRWDEAAGLVYSAADRAYLGFSSEALAGTALFAVLPGIGARYEF